MYLPQGRKLLSFGPSRAGGARSPGAVAALSLGATLLAARPRDTRTAPARPGPG